MSRDSDGLYWLHFKGSSGEWFFIHRQEEAGRKAQIRYNLLLNSKLGFNSRHRSSIYRAISWLGRKVKCTNVLMVINSDPALLVVPLQPRSLQAVAEEKSTRSPFVLSEYSPV